MQLYIIGNGFDRYHNLDTRYLAFAYFLQEHHAKLYDNLIKYFGLPDVDQDEPNDKNDRLWADFENVLANLDSETVLDDNTDYLPNIASEEYRDRDLHAMAQVMERIVDEMTKELFSAFKQFILAVHFPSDIPNKLCLNKNALFLSFNYTDTLERYYNIPIDQILYIHGNASILDDELILGHGINPDNFKSETQQSPEGLTEDEYDEWREHMADQYDYSYDSAKETLANYFERSYKHTATIVSANNFFFTQLSNVFQVTVLGHSLSDVDRFYVEKVYDSVHEKASWSASCFGKDQQPERIKKLLDLGVLKSRIRVFEMNSMRGIWNCFLERIRYFNAWLRCRL